MKLLRLALVFFSVFSVIFASCGGKGSVTSTPPSPTSKAQVKFQKFGWSVLVPEGEKVIEKGLIQKEADEGSGRIEWGDSNKGGLVSLFWIKGATRETYDVATGTDSLASSYAEPPVAIVTNFSELKHQTLANFEVDTRSYDFNFFRNELKGFIAAYQCTNPDGLFFINAIHKEAPQGIIEKILSGFSCVKIS